MRLGSMRDELRRELQSDRTLRLYREARRGVRALRDYPSMFALIGALDNRDSVGHRAQDDLLRYLVGRVQRRRQETLWRKILLYGFLPALARIQSKARSDADPDDVEALLWTVFLETLTAYPLRRRPGSVACGLVRDTRKKYHAALDRIREADKEQRQVILYMHRFDAFQVADHMVDDGPRFTADERAEARALLSRSPLQPNDVDLILATDIDGMTVPEYMKKRKLVKDDDADNQRERDRLWRRRIRARKKLYEYLRSLQDARPVLH